MPVRPTCWPSTAPTPSSILPNTARPHPQQPSTPNPNSRYPAPSDFIPATTRPHSSLPTTMNPTHFAPSLVTSAQTEALNAGKRHRRLIATRLMLVTTGALFGAFTLAGSPFGETIDYAGVLALLAFLGVIAIRLTLASDHPLQDVQRRGTAIAGLAYSHAWRYALGARPYVIAPDDEGHAGQSLLVTNLQSYQKIMLEYSWTTTTSGQITEPMHDLRQRSLDDRKTAYLQHRIEPLFTQSSLSSRHHTTRARRLKTLTLLIELVGIPAGIIKAVALYQIDLLGLTAAAAASLALWSDTLNLPQRARSEATTCIALASVTDMLRDIDTEYEWSVLVAKVEDQLTLDSKAALAADTMQYVLDAPADEPRTMSPEAYFAAAEDLKRQIWDESKHLPKLEPDVIVGVNPGGAIIGGILYFMTRASDFFPLSFRSRLGQPELKRMIDAAPWQARRSDRLSILVVDASIKSGDSMRHAVNLIRASMHEKGWRPASTTPLINQDSNTLDRTSASDTDLGSVGPAPNTYLLRTAVITKRPSTTGQDTGVQVDYFVDEVTERFPYGSI